MPDEKSSPPGSRAVDLGLLILRVGIGAVFIVHGVPKLLDGPPKWTELGQAMGVFGIAFAPVFWGFLCAVAEAVGGALLVLGLLVRPTAIVMFINMVVATALLVSMHQGWVGIAHPLSVGIVFLALAFTGGGRLALGTLVAPLANRWFR
jgi:putative oxidoreductase